MSPTTQKITKITQDEACKIQIFINKFMTSQNYKYIQGDSNQNTTT